MICLKQLDKDRKNVAEVITRYVSENGFQEKTNLEIKTILKSFNVEPKDVMYQNSDLCYNRTNKANLETFKEDIHIFEYLGRDRFRLLGLDYPYSGEIFRKPRKTGIEEVVGEWINGQLIKWEPYEVIQKKSYDKIIEKEICSIDAEIESISVDGIDRMTLVKTRVNQSVFRKRLLCRYRNCCLCKMSNQDLLIASHIKPWNVASMEERTDVNNGFIFCPNHDKAFDRGYISFAEDGKIIISDQLNDTDRIFLNIRDDMSVNLTKDNNEYLQYHRSNVFKQ